MFAIKRNQVIIIALVVMIAVAGYLNYIDSAQPEESLATSGTVSDISPLIIDEVTGEEVLAVNGDTIAANPIEGEIGIALTYEEGMDDLNPLVLNDVTTTTTEETSTAAEPPAEEEGSAAVFVNNTSDTSFFVQAKLEREQSRAKQTEMLTGMINNQNLDKEQKDESVSSMEEIRARIERETAAEALIEAKGFSEAYVRIDDNTVDVVVSKAVLSDAEIAQIEDIVKRKTGIDTANIRVAPLKGN